MVVQLVKGRRHRGRRGRGLDPRIPTDPRPPQRRSPNLAQFTCSECGQVSATRYRYCFAICSCGWLFKVEPAPRYGKLDDHGREDMGYAPIYIDTVRRVAPAGWEEASTWSSAGGDPVRRECGKCGQETEQEHRQSPQEETGAFDVTSCNVCQTPNPDQHETRTALATVFEQWRRQGKARIVLSGDGTPLGVQMPSHSEVDDETDLKAELRRQQEARG